MEKSVRSAVRILQDDAMLTKIAGINFSAKEVKYHYSCKRAYTNKAKRMDDTTNDDVRSGKHMFHNLAFEKLKQFIDTWAGWKGGSWIFVLTT